MSMTAQFIILKILVLAAILLWPARWLANRGRQMQELRARVFREDALKHIYKLDVNGRRPSVQSVAGALNIHSNRAAALLAEMEERALITFSSGEIQLTPAGRETALHVIRAHRLCESYLAEQTAVAESEWHI
jgi:DtxR family Mn-dependent transcriptional regulator